MHYLTYLWHMTGGAILFGLPWIIYALTHKDIPCCDHCGSQDHLFTLICGDKVCFECWDYSGAELKETKND